jgi:hypothetical protein
MTYLATWIAGGVASQVGNPGRDVEQALRPGNNALISKGTQP